MNPKYEIGQTVYCPEVKGASEQVDCPDCLGGKTWDCALPSGEKLTIPCPTCTSGHETTGTISSSRVEGTVRVLTIGSIRTDTNASPENQVEYMCDETGVGSGQIYHEGNLWSDLKQMEAALPDMIVKKGIELDENNARVRARKLEDGPGSMPAYYRDQIRRAEREIKAAERGLERESGKSTP